MMKLLSRGRTFLFIHFLFAVFIFLTPSFIEASQLRVSQESSAGAGDFDANILGFINPFITDLSTAAFYQYGDPYPASYNGNLNGGPAPLSDLSQIFFLDSEVDGLSLIVLHDKPEDGSGFTTQTRWNLSGDTADVILADDPGEQITVSNGNTQFDSTKASSACCTDGFAIGSLDGNWGLYGQFLSAPTGITDWGVVSADSSMVALRLEAGRRVRIDTVGSTVPEPATMLLLGVGMIGIAGIGRKK